MGMDLNRNVSLILCLFCLEINLERTWLAEFVILTLRDGQKFLNLNLRLDGLLHRRNQSFVQHRFLLLCPKLYAEHF